MISAVSPRGEFRIMFHDGSVNAEVFSKSIKRLMVGAATPVFLIVDGHPIHKAKLFFLSRNPSKPRTASSKVYLHSAALLAAVEPGRASLGACQTPGLLATCYSPRTKWSGWPSAHCAQNP